jgi:dTDP-3-amino-2,3,6-trideoxy-4-keto-D-glucose/dTDP-3-amino-3,4,6-trideoxy-alpha-D-glucose/dTDP-2,6-dideoxy-D-kanosamine transaminase
MRISKLRAAMSNKLIPFFSLSDQISIRKPEYLAATERVLDSGITILGSEVAQFEKEFADFTGADYCQGVANATDGIELALTALNLEEGVKVATVANAGGYSTTSILKARLKPIYMDVELETRNVTIEEVERAVNLGVKAVIVTHLYGLAVKDIKRIAEYCASRGVFLLEDCSQAHGLRVDGSHVGTFGQAGIFSFYPTKNLGGLGDGGALISSDSHFDVSIRKLRTYGWGSKYHTELSLGRNSRLDELQAAYLRINLKYLDSDNHARRRIANRYDSSFLNLENDFSELNRNNHVFHIYTMRIQRRDAFRNFMIENGIGTEIHFPVPDYKQNNVKMNNMFLKNTEELAKQIISLPCHPNLSVSDQERIIELTLKFLSE